ALCKSLRHVSEPPLDPLHELRRSRIGEGHGCYLIERAHSLRDQPDEQRRDGVGLASTGARFEERGPMKSDLPHVEWLPAHGSFSMSSRCLKRGWKMSRARAMNL